MPRRRSPAATAAARRPDRRCSRGRGGPIRPGKGLCVAGGTPVARGSRLHRAADGPGLGSAGVAASSGSSPTAGTAVRGRRTTAIRRAVTLHTPACQRQRAVDRPEGPHPGRQRACRGDLRLYARRVSRLRAAGSADAGSLWRLAPRGWHRRRAGGPPAGIPASAQGWRRVSGGNPLAGLGIRRRPTLSVPDSRCHGPRAGRGVAAGNAGLPGKSLARRQFARHRLGCKFPHHAPQPRLRTPARAECPRDLGTTDGSAFSGRPATGLPGLCLRDHRETVGDGRNARAARGRNRPDAALQCGTSAGSGSQDGRLDHRPGPGHHAAETG